MHYNVRTHSCWWMQILKIGMYVCQGFGHSQNEVHISHKLCNQNVNINLLKNSKIHVTFVYYMSFCINTWLNLHFFLYNVHKMHATFTVTLLNQNLKMMFLIKNLSHDWAKKTNKNISKISKYMNTNRQ